MKVETRHRLPLFAGAVLAIALCACTVGPKYHGAPPIAHDAEFVRAAGTAAIAMRPAAKWWLSLEDAELARLIASALKDSPDIEAATARVRKAHMLVRDERASQLPKLSANASALRSNANLNPGGSASSGTGSNGLEFYFVGFNASWEIDFFGKTKSSVRAARAQADMAEAELSNAQVLLAAEVGRGYVELRAHQQVLVLLQSSAGMQRKILELTEQRRSRGAASGFDVERARTELLNAQAMIIASQQDLLESLDDLAVLTGRAPGSLDAELAQTQPLPQLPIQVAIDDPAQMLRRRPDIRAAERQIAARAAIVNMRTADLFPRVSLLGSIGYGANSLSDLVHDASLIYLAAPVLSWSFLDFGANRARVGQAQADFDEAMAHYKSTVLSALQDAENSLSRFGNQRRNVISLQEIKLSADRATELASQGRTAGALSEIDLLDAERARLSAQQNLLQSQAALAESFISLQKSLGLGWESGAQAN